MDVVLKNYGKELHALKQSWPIWVGLLVVYIPTIARLFDSVWPKTEHTHGPIVFAITVWLFWRHRDVLSQSNDRARLIPGSVLLAFGCLLYALGRSQSILIFEVGSVIPVIAGIVLLTKGYTALKQLWFPIFFLIFLIPIPGFIIDALTGSLKQIVSLIVSDLLYATGYPIARSGVVLTIGPYQLLIADACSGLNSMFALSALGILFVYLKPSASKVHNIILLASILPIAFITNIVRVIALSLLTFYFGEEAGLGFSHDFAATAEFFVALVLLFSVDALLTRFHLKKTRSAT